MLSIVGELSWSWIPKDHVQVQNEKENFVVACLRSQQNIKLGIFTFVVVQSREKKCAVRVVLLSKLIAVLMFS